MYNNGNNNGNQNTATENLFLLEFLVDKVCIDPKAVPNDNLAGMCGESCVQFRFLNNEPLDVCEADFSPKNNYSAEGGTFKSGKSILFSLTPDQARTAVQDFNIHVSVFKKLPGNEMPDKMPVGEADIQIVNQFNELLKQIQCSSSGQPAAKVIKDTFKLLNADGSCVGAISVFVRISCFGKLIVTQFQMNLEDRSVLFKDNQGSSMYRYRKSQREQRKSYEDECVEGGRDDYHNQQRASYGNGYNQAGFGNVPCGEPLPNVGAQQQMPPLPPPPDNRCYQEIGAEMNGNALTIRVLKDKKKNIEIDDGCTCGQNQQSLDNDCCGDNPAITTIPEGPNPPSLNFKVNSGCTNQDLKVQPPRPVGGLQQSEISDPHRDVFVLRIGKKAEGAEKKSNLELELRTPKGLDRKPPPKLETRETQYEEADCGPAGNGGAKGKGGKKKGKKK